MVVLVHTCGFYFKGNRNVNTMVKDLAKATKFATPAKAQALLDDYRKAGYPMAMWTIQEVAGA
jgi:hypothetical protein